MIAGLTKWQLLAQTEYEAIVVVDLDVDLFLFSAGAPPADGSLQAEVLRHAWTFAVDSFLNSTLQLVAGADFHSPINSGALLLKPSQRVYRLGLRALERGAFDPLLGWDRVGRPQSVLRLDSLPARVAMSIRSATDPMRRNDWKFVGGGGDQRRRLCCCCRCV